MVPPVVITLILGTEQASWYQLRISDCGLRVIAGYCGFGIGGIVYYAYYLGWGENN
jgi:hypothetical protein